MSPYERPLIGAVLLVGFVWQHAVAIGLGVTYVLVRRRTRGATWS